MKKLTLVVAALMVVGMVFAQDGSKSCCKKGGKCSKECKKDKKSDSKESSSAKSTDKKSTAK